MIITSIYGDKCDKMEVTTNPHRDSKIPGWVTQKYPDEAMDWAVMEMNATGIGFYRGLRAGGYKAKDLLETTECFRINKKLSVNVCTCIIDKNTQEILYAAKLTVVNDEDWKEEEELR